MSLTIRERIAAELLRTLAAALTDVTVRRRPEVEFDQDELPALGLYLGDERVTFPSHEIADRRLEVTIVGHAAGDDGAAAETAANDLYGRTVIAVMADYGRGKLAVNTTETGLLIIDNTDEAGERPLVGFELSLEIEYWTQASDPTALAS